MKRTITKRKVTLLLLLTIILAIPVCLTYRAYHQIRLDRALIAALKRDDAPSALSLLAQGADANARDWTPQPTSFWQILWPGSWHNSASQNTAPSALLVALALLPSPRATSNSSVTPNLIEYPPENPPLIKALLDKGAEVNVADENGETPLLRAIQYGHEKTALLLLNHGANIHAMDSQGSTALLGAVLSGSETLVKALLERGANPNQMRLDEVVVGVGTLIWKYRQCPMLANAVFYPNLLNILLDGGANINTTDSEGRTALMWAIFFGEDEAARLLLKRGADVTLTAKNGDTALGVARKHKDTNMIRLLRQAGAKR